MADTCLVLNASFEPMPPINMKRALRLVLQGKAEVVEVDDGLIRSSAISMAKPHVIRLKKFVAVPKKFRRQVTNTFLFARDAYTCQYCGKHQSKLKGRSALTRDHVVPTSKGGTNTWDNCVTACTDCNWTKADRTPKQAGMKLLSTPTEPHIVHLYWTLRKLTPIQAKYIELFYGAEVLNALGG